MGLTGFLPLNFAQSKRIVTPDKLALYLTGGLHSSISAVARDAFALGCC